MDPAVSAPLSHGKPNDTFIGEYFGFDADDETFAVIWTDTRTGVQELFYLAGIEVIHWTDRQLGLSNPSDLSQLAATVSPGADGLCFLPYFSPAGERVPFLNTAARGSFFGLSFEHGRRSNGQARPERRLRW